MKTEFQAPVVAIRGLADENGAAVSSHRIFAPLSVPAIYENRIDLGLKSEIAPRRYRCKREDEAVN